MKQNFKIQKIDKKTASNILLKHHYLKDISKGFKSGFNYGLFFQESCVGVCIFTGFPVPELAKGLFNLERNNQEGLFELSRLCLEPTIQKKEHNLASWFVSRAIKCLKSETNVKAILSYADCEFHNGTIYKACNFKYYGLTEQKKDFWIENSEGVFVKHSRGKVKGLKGEWRNRSQKHRFLIVYDKSLPVSWQEKGWK